jgi:glycosyltransferase involved in cell wall biosynthesis
MRIGILGTRGIPASYSGFETSVEETAVRFASNNIDVTVYSRSNHFRERLNSYKGVNLVYISSIKTKHLDTISNTFLSVFHAIFQRFDVVILYGIGNSIFIPVLRIFFIPVISVVDGADWERKKWNALARWYLRMNRYFSVYFSNYYVVDNQKLAEEYSKKFHTKAVYIPYGANIDRTKRDGIPVLQKYNLQKKEYIIFVGRLVKEKGVDFLIRSFEKITTTKKLLIIGDNTTDIEYVNELKRTKDNRIVFSGYVYGAEYEILLANAMFYVSCSFLEGTSPSLLNAMALNGFAVVSDLKENVEVLKGSCKTFMTGNENDFCNTLEHYLKNGDIVESERQKSREIVQKYYDWEVITKQYIDLFNTCIQSKI